MATKLVLKSRLDHAIDAMSNEIRQHRPDIDCESTEDLCSLILLAMFDLIRSLYSMLEQRPMLAVDILLRSLVEYLVDLMFLADQNSGSYNRLFVNYQTLTRYWHLPSLGSLHEHVPEAADDYSKLVQDTFPNWLNEPARKSNKHGISTGDAERLEELIRASMPHLYEQFKLNCASKRISGILAETSLEPGTLEHSLWVDKKVKSIYSKHWSGLSFTDRAGKVKECFSNQNLYRAVLNRFRYHSSQTHPTIRAVHPDAYPPGEAVAQIEINVYALLSEGIGSYLKVSTYKMSSEVETHWKELSEAATSLAHATSPCHK